MGPNVRKLLAFLSACGFAASIFGYIESFSGDQADTIFRWWFVLFVGCVALFLPIYLLEYPDSRSPSFAWKGFMRGMPSWAGLCYLLLCLMASAQFVWFAVHSGWGVPEIQDGQYVLAARGQILKTLTQSEYLQLRSAEARTFAIVIVDCYFVPLTYWWFRQSRPHAD